MKDKKIRIGFGDIALFIISIIFVIGIRTAFQPCDPMEDGSWMTCHWAGEAVTGIAVVLLVISILHLFIGNAQICMGLDIAIFPLAVLALLIPGRVIHMCMMDDMRCHAVMAPAVLVLSVLMIAAAAADLLLQRRKNC